uniref:Uncharacterized protein n=1 Tax=Arundo donax TaxID=35708 RepID=A0A0A9FRV3_ARUDO
MRRAVPRRRGDHDACVCRAGGQALVGVGPAASSGYGPGGGRRHRSGPPWRSGQRRSQTSASSAGGFHGQ